MDGGALKNDERKLSYFAWHAFAYRADTAHLTREADYAYRRILDEIFITAQDTCQIVDDDSYLRTLCRATVREWAAVRHALIDGPRALLGKRDGHIYSHRLEEEIRKARGKSEQAKAAVEERERKRRSTPDERTMIERSSEDHLLRGRGKTESEKEEDPSSNRSGGSSGIDLRNFQPLWQKKQFQYKLDKINEWIEDVKSRRKLFPGDDDFAVAFKLRWSMTYPYWTAQSESHQVYFGAMARGAA